MNGPELKLPQACIFDLDGVIVDTAVYHYEAWKRLANRLGFDFTHLQNEQLKGISRMDSLELVLGWGNTAKTSLEKQHLATLKNIWYVEMIDKMTPAEVLPGIIEFLKLIKSSGIKIALGSASKNSKLILERTQIAGYFDAIVDGNSVSRSKPDPQVFNLGAELLDTDADKCIVFEDAVAGIEAGHRAGMKVIGIGSPEILTNADKVVANLKDFTLNDLAMMFNEK